MRVNICSCFGHSEIEITEQLRSDVKTKIEDMVVNENYRIFYFGGFGLFDDLCHQVVSELKQKYPDIKRVYCLSDPRHQRISKRPRWLKDEDYEEFVYLDLEFDWWYQRIYFRNVEMVNQSDYVLFYVCNRNNSGAYKIYQYAKKIKKSFTNFAQLV